MTSRPSFKTRDLDQRWAGCLDGRENIPLRARHRDGYRAKGARAESEIKAPPRKAGLSAFGLGVALYDPPPCGGLEAHYGGDTASAADVAKIRVHGVLQCLDACVAHKQCKAFTLNINPAIRSGPNCFLKYGTGRGEFYEQAISGVFLLPGEEAAFKVGTQTVMPAEVYSSD